MTLTKFFHMKTSEVYEGMPDSPNQQGQMGGNPAPVVDPVNLSDGESMVALEQIYPPATTKNHMRRRFEAPHKPVPEVPAHGSNHMISYEKFLQESDKLKDLIQLLVSEHSGETMDENMNRQVKRFPRVNN